MFTLIGVRCALFRTTGVRARSEFLTSMSKLSLRVLNLF
ncbi:hypothetical protein TPHV1_260021 [Treponema phagedenis]|uniref:Uncharacterized protein n=1 Tax=Treponema phagedenis TaxID=162 RepID=A0A0B7GWV6_TREPH|nr:hypothetical protein TPHV1_260021 [Treponema phagedenis]